MGVSRYDHPSGAAPLGTWFALYPRPFYFHAFTVKTDYSFKSEAPV